MWIYVLVLVVGLCAGYAVGAYMNRPRRSDVYAPIVTVEDLNKYDDQ